MLFYNKNKNVGSVTCSHTPTFIVEPDYLNSIKICRISATISQSFKIFAIVIAKTS